MGSQLGRGGQSEVFPVIDTQGRLAGQWALKRVLNPARHQRFLNEISAIKLLQHPNIITLVDHSALDDNVTNAEKKFLVMPIAQGGDLSDPQRLSLYRDTLDSVLHVAKQIATALATAHAAGIIHRDIKPQNILFTGNGHEIWLADFGVCLVREQERATEIGEVVGPRAFMAPELEGGGQLDVTPAADIYSLGKLIYYMLSGGTVIPREEIHDPKYRTVLQRGGRYSLLQSLLERMICPLTQRIGDVTEVARQLDSIDNWDRNAQLLPMSQSGLSALERLQQRSRDATRAAADDRAAREQEALTMANIRDAFQPWLQAELTKVAAHIAEGGTLVCEVRALTEPGNGQWRVAYGQNGFYTALTGLELRLEQPGDPFRRQHLLQIRLCQARAVVVTVSTGPMPPQVQAQPARDFQLAMVPFYRQIIAGQHPTHSGLMGYFTAKDQRGQIRGQIIRPQGQMLNRRQVGMTSFRLEPVTASFHDGASQCMKFKASEWVSVGEKLSSSLAESVDTFLEFLDAGANRTGP